MTLQPLDEDEIEDGTFDVFNDTPGKHRVEGWTDGSWVRLGRDVKDTKCLEFHIDKYDKTARYMHHVAGADRFRFRGRVGHNTYYVLAESPPLVLRKDETVLQLSGNESYFKQAKSLVKKERDELDAETLARSFTKSLRQFPQEIRCDRILYTSNVIVHYLPNRVLTMDIELIDELREHPAVFEDEVSVGFENTSDSESETMTKYRFKIDTSKLEGVNTDTSDDKNDAE